ncbi:MAG: ROK family protein [Methylophilaceae bacterium]|nr:ROK family protein [Methylophilaceae bacterium]
MVKYSSCLIGVDVGGTNLRVGVVQCQRVIWEQRVQADFSTFCHERPAHEALDFILDTLAGVIHEAQVRYPEASVVGIGFPGFIDPVTRRVTQSPNLPGLRDVDLSTPLFHLLKLPVIIENDALAAAYGEFITTHRGSGESLVYLGLGTGVGGGLILNGRPYAGTHGVAMEVGHLIIEPGGRPCGCGNRGCLEQYASATGVALTYAELSKQLGLDATLIAALAQEGDDNARRAFELAGDTLARGLATILKVVDVSRVVIGGGMCPSWQLMRAAFDARLDADLIPVLRKRIRISISNAMDRAGIVGAAMLALLASHEERGHA